MNLLLLLVLGIATLLNPEISSGVGRFEKGPTDSITDVSGVKVGHKTLISGEGKLKPGQGPIRTGVTVIIPGDDLWNRKMAAGSFVLNGNGEAMGLMWLQESGILETPIALTNTLSVGKVQTGLVRWMLKQYPLIGIDDDTFTPLVFECDDSTLNDIRGLHVTEAHVLEALENASGVQVQQGNVGSGTGLITYGFKGGVGSSSRIVKTGDRQYMLGVLVNANHGKKHNFRAPIKDNAPDVRKPHQDGSIVVIIATDAPLDARQLSRIAKRAMLGIARTGAVAYHGSGDVAVAFSTTSRIPHYPKKAVLKIELLSDFYLDPLFEASADAAEDALLNAMKHAQDMIGRGSTKIKAYR